MNAHTNVEVKREIVERFALVMRANAWIRVSGNQRFRKGERDNAVRVVHVWRSFVAPINGKGERDTIEVSVSGRMGLVVDACQSYWGNMLAFGYVEGSNVPTFKANATF